MALGAKTDPIEVGSNSSTHHDGVGAIVQRATEGEEMTLNNEQRAELEDLAPDTVRLMLLQGGAGRGASISGFKCGDITRGDINDWLIDKNIEEVALQRAILRWAKIAGCTGILGVIIGALAIYLAK